MENLYVSSQDVDLSQILHTIGDAISLTDSNMTFLGVNQRFAELYGLQPKDLIGVNAFEIYPEFKSSVFYEAFEHTIRTGEEATRIGYSNKLKTWIVSRSAKFDETRYIAISHVLRNGFNRVGMVYNYDSLTSLYNRHAFESDIHKVIAENLAFGILMIDIKNFRYLNEMHGLEFGDLCLMEVAARIKGIASHNVSIYRINADQFGVIFPMMQDESLTEAYKILNVFKKPITINSEEYKVSAYSGFYYINNPLNTATEILNNVEAALAEAKKQNLLLSEYSDKTEHLKEKLKLVKEFKTALANGKFQMYYQAQVDTINSKICGIEALIRWPHPINGLLTPFAFLPIAEEYDLIEDLDKWVIINVFSGYSELLSKNINIPVSINISAQSISNKHFINFIQAAVERIKINPKNIVFELTETALAHDVISKENIIKLRDMNFKVSIDDFGTGYASFRYLIQYPSDFLKIDRSFITDLHKNKKLQSIVHNMIKMAHSLGIIVVAEGAERTEEVQKLKEFECDIIQGYIYSKPESKPDIIKRIHAKGISNLKSVID